MFHRKIHKPALPDPETHKALEENIYYLVNIWQKYLIFLLLSECRCSRNKSPACETETWRQNHSGLWRPKAERGGLGRLVSWFGQRRPGSVRRKRLIYVIQEVPIGYRNRVAHHPQPLCERHRDLSGPEPERKRGDVFTGLLTVRKRRETRIHPNCFEFSEFLLSADLNKCLKRLSVCFLVSGSEPVHSPVTSEPSPGRSHRSGAAAPSLLVLLGAANMLTGFWLRTNELKGKGQGLVQAVRHVLFHDNQSAWLMNLSLLHFQHVSWKHCPLLRRTGQAELFSSLHRYNQTSNSLIWIFLDRNICSLQLWLWSSSSKTWDGFKEPWFSDLVVNV